jgi:hypothetical protein
MKLLKNMNKLNLLNSMLFDFKLHVQYFSLKCLCTHTNIHKLCDEIQCQYRLGFLFFGLAVLIHREIKSQTSLYSSVAYISFKKAVSLLSYLKVKLHHTE